MKVLMIVVIFAILFGVATLHRVPEETRLLEVVDGKAGGLLGPGWVFVVPGARLVQPLTLGEAGISLGDSEVDFAGQAVSVVGYSGPAGQPVRIASFQDRQVRVAPVVAPSP